MELREKIAGHTGGSNVNIQNPSSTGSLRCDPSKFHIRAQEKIMRRVQRTRIIKLRFAWFLLLAFAWTAFGFFSGESETVKETYTVRPGDTLRGISEMYLSQNAGQDSYILEFEQTIRDMNPWLRERHGQLRPGDRLVIRYKTVSEPHE